MGIGDKINLDYYYYNNQGFEFVLKPPFRGN